MTSGGGLSGGGTGAYGQAGSLAQGGNGAGGVAIYGGSYNGAPFGGGGGGGGYYGGAGGMSGGWSTEASFPIAGGGGAGSSYIDTGIFSNLVPGGAWYSSGLVRIIFTYTSPVVNAGGPSTVCAGNSVTLNASGVSSYTWLPLGSFPGSTNSSISVSPVNFSTYSVIATNSLGCISSTVVNVTPLSYSPAISVANSASLNGGICPGQSATLTASGAISYVWTGTITNGVGFTPSSAQTYTVTGSNGCGSGTAVSSVSIHLVPSLSVTVSQPTVCAGTSVSLSATGASSYILSPATFSLGIPFIPQSSASFTTTGTSVMGCTATAISSLAVVPFPTVIPVASPPQVCNGSSVNLTASGASYYLWLPVNNLSPSLTVYPSSSTIYTAVLANSNCSVSFNVPVTVYAVPLATALASATQVCAGSSVTLNASGGSSYLWYNSQGLFAASANTTVYPNTNSTYTAVVSNGSCSASSSITISTLATPSLSVSPGSYTLCRNDSVQIAVTGAASYLWNSGAATATLWVKPSVNTVYTVTGTNTVGCSSSAQVSLQVLQIPTVTIVSTGSLVCAGKSATLTASGAPQYLWNTTSTNSAIQVTPAGSSTYSVTGSFSTGCSSTATAQVNSYTPQITITGPTLVCIGKSYTLNAVGAVSYTWNGTSNSSTFTSIAASNSIIMVAAETNSGNVMCDVNKTFTLNAAPLPSIQISPSSKEICSGESATLNATGAASYTWYPGGAAISIVANLPATTVFTVNGTDINNCSNSVTFQLNVLTCTAIEENNLTAGGRIFPNPANNEVNIFSADHTSFMLISSLGQIIYQQPSSNCSPCIINTTHFADGIYILAIQKGNVTTLHKLVVGH
jgi:hypothetical protein